MGRSKWTHQRMVETTQKSPVHIVYNWDKTHLWQRQRPSRRRVLRQENPILHRNILRRWWWQVWFVYWLYIFWDNLLGSGFQNLQASLFNLAGFLSSTLYTMVTCKIAIEIPRWKMFSRWPGKTSCSKWGPLHVVYHPGLNKFGPSPFRSLLRGDIYSRMVNSVKLS